MTQDFSGDKLRRHLGHVGAFAHVGIDRRRHYRHHVYALVTKISAQCLAQRQQRRLRRAVRRHQRQIHFRKGRGHRHDHSFAAFDHLWRQRAGHAQCAEIVDIHFAHRGLEIHLQRIAIAGNAGVVHQNVDEAEIRGCVHIVFARYVEFDRRDWRADRRYVALQLLNVRCVTRAGKNFARAACGERQGERAAEAATRAGD